MHAGLLAGVLTTEAQEGISEGQRSRVDAHRSQIEAHEALCRELAAEPAEVRLAWLLHNPVVSRTIVGAMSVQELQADLGALSVQLDEDTLRQLDRIWPGPGEAPQAYSW